MYTDYIFGSWACRSRVKGSYKIYSKIFTFNIRYTYCYWNFYRITLKKLLIKDDSINEILSLEKLMLGYKNLDLIRFIILSIELAVIIADT